MDDETSGMVAPFVPAMAGSAALSATWRVRESILFHSGIMQILAGEIADSIRIDPHPRQARGSVGVQRPTPCSATVAATRVLSILILPYSTLQRASLM